LAKIETTEEQQKYYDTVIYPCIYDLEKTIDHRHNRHKDYNDLSKVPCKGDFIESVFVKLPDDLHEIISDLPVLCRILKNLKYAQKEVIFYDTYMGHSNKDMAHGSDTSERNIRKSKATALRHIRGQLLPVIMFKYKIQTDEKYRNLVKNGVSTSFRERRFAAIYGEDYADYYDDLAMDFVEITKDYRAQERRMKDNYARWKEQIRLGKALEKERKRLQKQNECGNIIIYNNSYIKGVDTDYAQNI